MTSAYDLWLTTEPEEPETCPECQVDNSDEDGELLDDHHFPFCSDACHRAFDVREAEHERKALTCPKCGHHLDDHFEVTAHDSEFGDYETYGCPTAA